MIRTARGSRSGSRNFISRSCAIQVSSARQPTDPVARASTRRSPPAGPAGRSSAARTVTSSPVSAKVTIKKGSPATGEYPYPAAAARYSLRTEQDAAPALRATFCRNSGYAAGASRGRVKTSPAPGYRLSARVRTGARKSAAASSYPTTQPFPAGILTGLPSHR